MAIRHTLLAVLAVSALAIGASAATAAIDARQAEIGQRDLPALLERDDGAAVRTAKATECVGGYRIIHQVQSRGKPMPGVLVRCRG